MSEPLDVNLVHKLSTAKYIGRTFINKLETDSTMEDARKLIESGLATHGTVICAEFQTQGRGRTEGKTWDSGRELNIICTIIFEQSKVQDPRNRLALATPIAIARTLRKFGINAAIKWPNDVHVAGRKISGMMVNSNDNFYVLGFGVNVNEIFEPPALDKCSVREILNKSASREAILAEILSNLELLLAMETPLLITSYRALDCLSGSRVTVTIRTGDESTPVSALVKSVNDDGFLLAEIDGNDRVLSAEEVSVRYDNLPERFKTALLPRAAPPAQLLVGVWRNQLGSLLTFTAATENGFLAGYYQTAVGNVPSATQYPLYGSYQPLDDGGAVLGWVVSWNQPVGAQKSLSTWAGRLNLNPTFEPSIDSTWLLISDAPAWESVNTNKDLFTKQPI